MREDVTKHLLRSITELNAEGINLYAELDKEFVLASDGVGCSGFFEPNDKILAFTVGSKSVEDWFGTFLHEFNHFRQFREKSPIWDAAYQGDPSIDYFGELLSDRPLPKGVEAFVRAACEVEYDCEKRTAKDTLLFPDIFDTKAYIKKCNAYIAFYKIVLETRKWYDPSKAPYLNESIWKKMPDYFLNFSSYWDDYQFRDFNWEDCLEK